MRPDPVWFSKARLKLGMAFSKRWAELSGHVRRAKDRQVSKGRQGFLGRLWSGGSSEVQPRVQTSGAAAEDEAGFGVQLVKRIVGVMCQVARSFKYILSDPGKFVSSGSSSAEQENQGCQDPPGFQTCLHEVLWHSPLCPQFDAVCEWMQ